MQSVLTFLVIQLYFWIENFTQFCCYIWTGGNLLLIAVFPLNIHKEVVMGHIMSIPFLIGIGWQEIVLIFLVLLLLFGAKRLPELARGLGKGIREFKGAVKDVEDELDDAAKSVGDTSDLDKPDGE